MVVAGTHETIPVDEIELDRSNPRIRKFLEMYGDDPTSEQVFLALAAGNDDESDRQVGPTFQKLKQSIITNGGIIQLSSSGTAPNTASSDRSATRAVTLDAYAGRWGARTAYA